MYEWHKQIQIIVDEIDECIKHHHDEALTLRFLSRKLGYSEFHTTRIFKKISGMKFRDYLRLRKLAFALIEVRDSERSIFDIAFDYGFSSHVAFTRAFKATYGIAPSEYRKKPKPVVLRTKVNPFDRYLLGIGEIGMIKSTEGVKIYFVTIPAHKFLHIKNYESNGYWDFWKNRRAYRGRTVIPSAACSTVSRASWMTRVAASLTVAAGKWRISANRTAGPSVMEFLVSNVMVFVLLLIIKAKCHHKMLMIDVPEAEYVVFEHGPFDYEQENRSVEEKVDTANATFDFADTAYCFDTSPGRMAYFYHDPTQFWKCIRPVRKS